MIEPTREQIKVLISAALDSVLIPHESMEQWATRLLRAALNARTVPPPKMSAREWFEKYRDQIDACARSMTGARS
jgi:hypothetical protein